MANWPAISPPAYGLEEEVYRPHVRSEFEVGYVQSRPRSLRSVRRWRLSWDLLSESDYQLLKTFFETYQGGSFTWTHPVSAVQYTCRFSGDSLPSRIVAAGWRSCECPIEEV